ncbi:MAG TPA: hypothetical protein VNO52_02420 [Methylomirabilota bacterium]|nr:hypothetical protein [Methylomirabilota bacterium]
MTTAPRSPGRIATGMLCGISMVWGLSVPAADPAFTIRWIAGRPDTNRYAVEVSGVPAAVLREIERQGRTPEQWQRLLRVHVTAENWLEEMETPPMLGQYAVAAGRVRFKPRYPLGPGVRYRAVFLPGELPGEPGNSAPVVSEFQRPARRSVPATVVRQVYPTADHLPENLLKFYLHFSAPMSRGHIYDHIHLRNQAGQDVELPFLEIDEELWDATLTRLTLIIDPGRIKRGVRPLEEIGPALVAGGKFTLVIDRDWRDADGVPLKDSFQKTFTVGPPDREALDPMQWRIESPARGSKEALVVRFPKPLDHALAQRMIRVAREDGAAVEGRVSLADAERRWVFAPVKAWRPGAHSLVVQTALEDLAGNNVGKSFEVDLFEGVQRRLTNGTVRVPFRIL